MVSGVSSLSSPPPMIRASVASTPGPPALVTMVRRGPFGTETHFSIDDFGECLAGAADVFQPIRRPFKRTAQLSCRYAQEDFFGIKRALGAKAPAHIRRHNTQPA